MGLAISGFVAFSCSPVFLLASVIDQQPSAFWDMFLPDSLPVLSKRVWKVGGSIHDHYLMLMSFIDAELMMVLYGVSDASGWRVRGEREVPQPAF